MTAVHELASYEKTDRWSLAAPVARSCWVGWKRSAEIGPRRDPQKSECAWGGGSWGGGSWAVGAAFCACGYHTCMHMHMCMCMCMHMYGTCAYAVCCVHGMHMAVP